MNATKAVTFYLLSGGASSTLAAYHHRKTAKTKPIFYFNDTLIEDPDLYRFLVESAYFLSMAPMTSEVSRLLKDVPELAPGITIADRRFALDRLFSIVCSETGLIRSSSVDPWEAFEISKYIGNTRIDVCSRILKREPRFRFTKDVADSEICLGFSWPEMDRFEKALSYESNIISPLATDFVDTNLLFLEFFEASGIQKSRSYDSGFPHDNCGGFCVKAGLGQFRLLWEARPMVYLWHEEKMEAAIGRNPKLRPFLRKVVSGKTIYLTLKEYRIDYLLKGADADLVAEGGCGCAML